MIRDHHAVVEVPVERDVGGGFGLGGVTPCPSAVPSLRLVDQDSPGSLGEQGAIGAPRRVLTPVPGQPEKYAHFASSKQVKTSFTNYQPRGFLIFLGKKN